MDRTNYTDQWLEAQRKMFFYKRLEPGERTQFEALVSHWGSITQHLCHSDYERRLVLDALSDGFVYRVEEWPALIRRYRKANYG